MRESVDRLWKAEPAAASIRDHVLPSGKGPLTNRLDAVQGFEMTNARLARVPRPDIDYAGLSFNPDDPEPLPDAMYQYPILEEILPILGAHLNRLHSREEAFRSSNTFICYDPDNLNVRVGPDFYFASGVDAPAIEGTKLYLPWEVGKPPDFVLEIASESTAEHDVTGKRQIYAEIGVPEYWRFDRSGGAFYGEPLAGERLVDGIYQPVPLSGEPDGILKGYSPALRLSLCWDNEMLRFYDPGSGEYLRNFEAEQARADSEQAARQAEQVRADSEQAARERAEARVRELQEELERRDRES